MAIEIIGEIKEKITIKDDGIIGIPIVINLGAQGMTEAELILDKPVADHLLKQSKDGDTLGSSPIKIVIGR
ncbi:MAG: hypothetical protein QF632_05050 [Candidatus Woesearchaeota archaeon]|jgi:hypothetical protein|nr:hypothetical protein [Candidatus Woesearchaeota archaeon]MDP7324098.1 hypothetical protein [Candidatus Woesearchaeota archaeon]MDP7458007.1 hypothetical protein [Candidatus Woesearchaeota archaeon]|tara:strand:+ start:800 stop:1012 length:213 start_codon:yes stop_codon:yes gene_type:complete